MRKEVFVVRILILLLIQVFVAQNLLFGLAAWSGLSGGDVSLRSFLKRKRGVNGTFRQRQGGGSEKEDDSDNGEERRKRRKVEADQPVEEYELEKDGESKDKRKIIKFDQGRFVKDQQITASAQNDKIRIVGFVNGTLEIYNVRTKDREVVVPTSGGKILDIKILGGPGIPGRKFAIISRDGVLRIFDYDELLRGEKSCIKSFVYGPSYFDFKTSLAGALRNDKLKGYLVGYCEDDNILNVWDIEKNKRLTGFKLGEQKKGIRATTLFKTDKEEMEEDGEDEDEMEDEKEKMADEDDSKKKDLCLLAACANGVLKILNCTTHQEYDEIETGLEDIIAVGIYGDFLVVRSGLGILQIYKFNRGYKTARKLYEYKLEKGFEFIDIKASVNDVNHLCLFGFLMDESGESCKVQYDYFYKKGGKDIFNETRSQCYEFCPDVYGSHEKRNILEKNKEMKGGFFDYYGLENLNRRVFQRINISRFPHACLVQKENNILVDTTGNVRTVVDASGNCLNMVLLPPNPRAKMQDEDEVQKPVKAQQAMKDEDEDLFDILPTEIIQKIMEFWLEYTEPGTAGIAKRKSDFKDSLLNSKKIWKKFYDIDLEQVMLVYLQTHLNERYFKQYKDDSREYIDQNMRFAMLRLKKYVWLFRHIAWVFSQLEKVRLKNDLKVLNDPKEFELLDSYVKNATLMEYWVDLKTYKLKSRIGIKKALSPYSYNITKRMPYYLTIDLLRRVKNSNFEFNIPINEIFPDILRVCDLSDKTERKLFLCLLKKYYEESVRIKDENEYDDYNFHRTLIILDVLLQRSRFIKKEEFDMDKFIQEIIKNIQDKFLENIVEDKEETLLDKFDYLVAINGMVSNDERLRELKQKAHEFLNIIYQNNQGPCWERLVKQFFNQKVFGNMEWKRLKLPIGFLKSSIGILLPQILPQNQPSNAQNFIEQHISQNMDLEDQQLNAQKLVRKLLKDYYNSLIDFEYLTNVFTAIVNHDLLDETIYIIVKEFEDFFIWARAINNNVDYEKMKFDDTDLVPDFYVIKKACVDLLSKMIGAKGLKYLNFKENKHEFLHRFYIDVLYGVGELKNNENLIDGFKRGLEKVINEHNSEDLKTDLGRFCLIQKIFLTEDRSEAKELVGRLYSFLSEIKDEEQIGYEQFVFKHYFSKSWEEFMEDETLTMEEIRLGVSKLQRYIDFVYYMKKQIKLVKKFPEQLQYKICGRMEKLFPKDARFIYSQILNDSLFRELKEELKRSLLFLLDEYYKNSLHGFDFLDEKVGLRKYKEIALEELARASSIQFDEFSEIVESFFKYFMGFRCVCNHDRFIEMQKTITEIIDEMFKHVIEFKNVEKFKKVELLKGLLFYRVIDRPSMFKFNVLTEELRIGLHNKVFEVLCDFVEEEELSSENLFEIYNQMFELKRGIGWDKYEKDKFAEKLSDKFFVCLGNETEDDQKIKIINVLVNLCVGTKVREDVQKERLEEMFKQVIQSLRGLKSLSFNVVDVAVSEMIAALKNWLCHNIDADCNWVGRNMENVMGELLSIVELFGFKKLDKIQVLIGMYNKILEQSNVDLKFGTDRREAYKKIRNLNKRISSDLRDIIKEYKVSSLEELEQLEKCFKRFNGLGTSLINETIHNDRKQILGLLLDKIIEYRGGVYSNLKEKINILLEIGNLFGDSKKHKDLIEIVVDKLFEILPDKSKRPSAIRSKMPLFAGLLKNKLENWAKVTNFYQKLLKDKLIDRITGFEKKDRISVLKKISGKYTLKRGAGLSQTRRNRINKIKKAIDSELGIKKKEKENEEDEEEEIQPMEDEFSLDLLEYDAESQNDCLQTSINIPEDGIIAGSNDDAEEVRNFKQALAILNDAGLLKKKSKLDVTFVGHKEDSIKGEATQTLAKVVGVTGNVISLEVNRKMFKDKIKKGDEEFEIFKLLLARTLVVLNKEISWRSLSLKELVDKINDILSDSKRIVLPEGVMTLKELKNEDMELYYRIEDLTRLLSIRDYNRMPYGWQDYTDAIKQKHKIMHTKKEFKYQGQVYHLDEDEMKFCVDLKEKGPDKIIELYLDGVYDVGVEVLYAA